MKRKELRAFDINIHRLANGEHEFQFKVSNELLDFFEQNIVEGASGQCDIVLIKTETMMTLKFQIAATVDLICDVSLKPYTQDVQVVKELIIKFGEEEKELSEDVLVMHWDTQQINVAEYIYEFLLLAVPMKRIHPDIAAEDRPELIYVSESENGDDDDDDAIDPRWEALKKLK
ncbi:MAG: DUF177 domain-containing protein [Bacteroidota bacterium]